MLPRGLLRGGAGVVRAGGSIDERSAPGMVGSNLNPSVFDVRGLPQAQLLETYASLASRHEWLAGVHVWNLCDFRTPQASRAQRAAREQKSMFSQVSACTSMCWQLHRV